MSTIRRVIAVDWSGDAHSGRRKIWLCEVADGKVLRLENGRSRSQIVEHLAEEGRRDPGLVVGLDFAFSFPAAFLRKRMHQDIASVWKEARLLGEDWLANCPNPPFWGKPGKKKPAFGDPVLLRETEQAVARETGSRPFSVFQVGGVGAIGVGSIRGMPHLATLRDQGFSIWPFDEPRLPLVIEIWPRTFVGNVRKSRSEERRQCVESRYPELEGSFLAAAEDSDDAFDALVSALEMDRHRDELGRLRRATDGATLLEGAIWRPRA